MPRKTKGHLYKRDKQGHTIPKADWPNRHGRYWLEYWVNGARKRQSLDETEQEEAEKARDRIIKPLEAADKTEKLKTMVHRMEDAQEDHAAIVEATRDKLRLADAWVAYERSRTRPQSGPVTMKDYSQQWGKFVRWWEARNEDAKPFMDDVTPQDASEFAAYLEEEEKLSPRRYNMIIQTCKRMFTVLASECNDMPNPYAGIARKRPEPQGRRELSEGELRDVCAKASGELRTLLATGIYTGMRLGDCCLLRWEEVNLHLNAIMHQHRKTKSRNGKHPPIPIHPVLRAILEETGPDARRDYVLPEFAELYSSERTKASKRIQKHFSKVCGIETQHTKTGARTSCKVGFHSLRHSFVTMAAKAGVPLPIIQELCGHGSPAIQRVYMHMGEEETRRAILALPDIIEATEDKSDVPDTDAISEAIRLLAEMSEQSWEGTRDSVVEVLKKHQQEFHSSVGM